jgi:hypothetical protein
MARMEADSNNTPRMIPPNTSVITFCRYIFLNPRDRKLAVHVLNTYTGKPDYPDLMDSASNISAVFRELTWLVAIMPFDFRGPKR